MNAYILIKKVASLGLLGLSIAAASAQAQNYPTKPIRFLVGFGPGGPTDVVARVLGNAMSQLLGQPIVVENRAGADSLIATQAVARADPDGYLLLIASGSHSINASLYPETKVDPVRDFSHVGMIGDAANFLVVHPSVPANNADEFLKLLRDNPGKYNSGTTASTTFLATQLFQTMAGVDTQNIPYKGAGPGTLALVAGEIQMSITSLVGMLPQVKANKVKPLAVTSAARSPLAPDVPTLTEKALPGYVASTWYAMFAPANTPREIINKLSTEAQKALDSKDLRATLDSQSINPWYGTPEQLGALLKTEIPRYATIVKSAGIQQQ
jgi:tripartite-type tricarboxylate transporter receptor subunit TctC